MLLILLLCSQAFTNSIPELDQENEELRISNEILHKQLLDLSKFKDMSIIIQEDFTYNKEKLQALINEFNKESSDSIQIALVNQILYFLKVLHEDLLIMESNDQGINAKDIDAASKKLKDSLDKFKTRQENKEFSRAYQELKQSVERKDQSLQTLQLENAKLIGKLDSAVAELAQHNQNYSHVSKKLEELQESLEKTQKDQAERLENLKSSLQTEEQASRSKEIEDFKKIQDSQDELIDILQSKNSEQTLKIEELSLEKSNLISKLRLLNSTIERLNNEIEARSKQLEQSENKFEDFRRQIEYETNDEIINLRNSEQQIKDEVNILQLEQITLLESITNCTKDLDSLEMEKRQKENIIKELELLIKEARNGIQSAKEGRAQEIFSLEEKVKDAETALGVLQCQVEESLLKISTQNAEIRELNEKLDEYKFLNNKPEPQGQKGSLRGYSSIFNI
ncbi:hypothetical protein SteCoe_29753 [Stentor coeruleus]|uniref:Uncharacterized protein n=1 Tax=Stentor coeruleus TaxID=5963 RepID=A0A1R2B592_9CILI|nr:hypothetical protein SteCoe_29753 [Stentor coeruleus]